MKANNNFLLYLFPALLLAVALQSCTGPHVIGKSGLSYIRLGDAMPSDNDDTLAGFPLRDTSFAEDDFKWPAEIVEYSEGRVLIEGDLLEGSSVSRIRIETPELQLKNGFRIGGDLADLWKMSEQWQARPFARYGLIEMISPDLPRKVFLLKEEGFDYKNAPEEVGLDQLSPDSKVVMIVLM